MKNIQILMNSEGEIFFSKETENGVIYSFAADFEDYWTESEHDLYRE